MGSKKAPASRRSDDRMTYERVRLRDEATAIVLTACDHAGPAGETISALPTTVQWAQWLECALRDSASLDGYTTLKYSADAEVFRASLAWDSGALDVVCKHSRESSLLGHLRSIWRPPPERRDFERLRRLLQAGVPTAVPLALVERRSPRREAWLVTALLHDVIDLDQVALAALPKLDEARTRGAKCAIIDAVVDLFGRMFEQGIHHRDMKASNILLSDWDGGGRSVRVYVVDVEGICGGLLAGKRQHLQPMMRLAASLLEYRCVTRTDYARFLLHYLSRTGESRTLWKSYYRKLAASARDYRRSARRRKATKLDGYSGEP